MKLSSLACASLSLVALVNLAGCSKPTAEEQKKQEAAMTATLTSALALAAAAPATAPAKGGAPLVIELTKLGLKGAAAGETEAPIIGSGDPAMVMAATFAANVAEAKPTDPKKVKDGEQAAKMFNPKGMKSETLPDGWALTYTNTGSAGTNYFVSVRRDIGGKGYLCETTQSTVEQQNAALAFCKSLTK